MHQGQIYTRQCLERMWPARCHLINQSLYIITIRALSFPFSLTIIPPLFLLCHRSLAVGTTGSQSPVWICWTSCYVGICVCSSCLIKKRPLGRLKGIPQLVVESVLCCGVVCLCRVLVNLLSSPSWPDRYIRKNVNAYSLYAHIHTHLYIYILICHCGPIVGITRSK